MNSVPTLCLLFVYGTLMQGFRNPFAKKLQKNATWRGKGTFAGQLFDLGSYPGAIFNSNTPSLVHGEVWEITDFDSVIPSLDYYEGIHEANPEYIRQSITIRVETGEEKQAWAYLFCQSTTSLIQIKHGDYRQWLLEHKQHL